MTRSSSSADRPRGSPDQTEHRRRFRRLALFVILAAAGATVLWMSRPGRELGQDPGAGASATRPLVVTVGYGDIENAVSAPGTLSYRELVPVAARASGKLEKLFVEPGDRVQAGQLLAAIDAREQKLAVMSAELGLEQLKNQIAPLELGQRIADEHLERQRALEAAGRPVERELEAAQRDYVAAQTSSRDIRLQIEKSQIELDRQKVQLDYTQINAPLAGTVISVDVKEGALLTVSDSGPIVMRIADLSRLNVIAAVAEADVPALQAGMDVYFTTFSDNGRRRRYTKLDRIDPVATTAYGSVRYNAHLEIDNADGALRPGMTVQAFFVTSAASNVLTVPVAALTFPDTPDGPRSATVDVVLPDGAIETCEIVVGAMDRTNAEVVSGLAEGDRVVAGLVAT
jgi:membrane fusion protein, macrolide-specific efflux system